MTTLILQTAGLLLCAYFLGAWVACIVRRMVLTDRHEGHAIEAPVARPVAASVGTVAPPARRPDPKPIAIETIERAAPTAAADAASRFEKVLTNAPTAVATTPAIPPAAAKTPAPIPAAATPAISTQAAAAATAAVATVAAATQVVAKPAAPATAVPAVAPPPAAPAAKPAAPPVAVAPSPAATKPAPAAAWPAASSGAGPSAVSAPLAPAVASDDLTRIRAIDSGLQQKLNKLGVTRYREIAGWRPADVERISREFGFAGRVEQENWIEQAQILARGGETAYARRKDSGLVPTAAPTASEGVAKPAPAAPPVAPVAPVAKPAPVAAAPVAPSPAATVSKPQVETRAGFAPPPAAKPAAPTPAAPSSPSAAAAIPAPKPAVTTTAASAPVPAPKPAAPAPVSAPVVAKPAAAAPAAPAVPVASAGLAAAAAAAAAAGGAAASGLGRDNLQRIGGINSEVERLLNVQGVSRYSHVAAWSDNDAMRIDRLLGQDGRVRRETWIEQAAVLSRGGDTAFSRQFDQRALAAKAAAATTAPTPAPGTPAPKPVTPAAAAAPVPPVAKPATPVAAPAATVPAVPAVKPVAPAAPPAAEAPRPAKLDEAIRDTAGKVTAPVVAAAVAGAAAVAKAVAPSAPAPAATPSAPGAPGRPGDMASLRSVRSEAYAQPSSGKGRPDDLKRIRGIGVLIERKLNSMGVSSYAQVANWSAADIDRVSQVLDFRGRIERENWVEQARILTAGGQTEFSRRVDRGEVETSRG